MFTVDPVNQEKQEYQQISKAKMICHEEIILYQVRVMGAAMWSGTLMLERILREIKKQEC